MTALDADRLTYTYTCRSCGRSDHVTTACPAPVDRAVRGYLCLHASPPEVIRVGYQCGTDLAIYEGDTVTVETTFNIFGPPTSTARATRGCRAESEGRTCTGLPAGHHSQFNHKDPATGLHWPVEPATNGR